MNDPFECYGVDLCAPYANVDLVAALTERGVALIDRVGEPGALLRLAYSIGVVVPHRDSAADGVTELTNLGVATGSGFAGFTSRGLEPHTDCAGLAHPPGLVLMMCGQAAVSGGECLLVDGQSVHDDLATGAPEALQALFSPRCALFGGAAGYLGSVFTTSSCGDWVTVRLRLDALARFAPLVTRWLPALRAAIGRHATAIKLGCGQGYVLHNHRWLHGRRAFTGQRVMFRVHADPLAPLEIPAGFRSTITANAA